MEAKYSMILLLCLAASWLGDCFVLSKSTAFTNTNAEKPAEEEREDTFTPTTTFPLSSHREGLEEKSEKYAAANELISRGLEVDIGNTNLTIQGRNETGDNGPSIEAIPNTYFGSLFSLTCFMCAAAVLFLELMYNLSKYVKRAIWHRIFH